MRCIPNFNAARVQLQLLHFQSPSLKKPTGWRLKPPAVRLTCRLPPDLPPLSVACQVVEAIEYLKRPERLGLGAQSVPTAPTTKRPRKMGRWRCAFEWGCVGKRVGGFVPRVRLRTFSWQKSGPDIISVIQQPLHHGLDGSQHQNNCHLSVHCS